jgi:hypothetical protein
VRERFGSCHLFRCAWVPLKFEGGADVRCGEEFDAPAGLDSTQFCSKLSVEKLRCDPRPDVREARLEGPNQEIQASGLPR